MKKLFVLCLAVCMLVGVLAAPAYADQPVRVLIDDENITFDVNPVVMEGRLLVPVRKVVESMGGDVTWNERNRTVTIEKDGTTIVLVIDSRIAKVNDADRVLDVPARVIKGWTMVPLRFVSENLNAKVSWDQNNRKITVNTPVNIDETALALLLKANDKSKEVRKFKADLSGSMTMDMTTPEGTETVQMGLVGVLRVNAGGPAFSYKGKATLSQRAFNRELNLEFILVDNVMYFKDPFTGKWDKQKLEQEDTVPMNNLLSQSVSNQVYFDEFFKEGKAAGLFRNISFAGDRNINGVETTGVYVEVNGLKLASLLREIAAGTGGSDGNSQGGTDTGKQAAQDQAVPDQASPDAAAQAAAEAVTMDKIKYTMWIGKQDNNVYGYDIEFRMKMKNPDTSEERVFSETAAEIVLSLTIDEINQPQDITAPKVDETGESGLPGLNSFR